MTRLSKIVFVLICTTIAVSILAYGTVHQPIIALFYLSVTAMVLLWAADCFFGGAVRFSRSPLQIPLALLGIYAVVQSIPFGTFMDTSGMGNIPRTLSWDPFSTQTAAVHIFVLCIFFAITLAYLDRATRLRRMVTFITVFGFVYAFYAILQAVLSPGKIYGIYAVPYTTPFGSFVNRHDFAAVMEMAVAVPLGMWFSCAITRDKKLLYGVAVALMGAALLSSGSRGGLIAFIAEIIVLVFVTTRTKGTRNIVLKTGLSFLLVAAAIGGAVLVGGDTSLTRLSADTSSHDITSNRGIIWSATVKMIGNNLPFGSGIGAYQQAYTAYDPLSGAQRVEQAHNDYLQILADAGIVGLVIGGLFLFWFLREGKRNTSGSNTFRRGVAAGAFAGCFAILIHSLFDFVLHITAISVMFLTLLAMLVSSGRKYDDDIDEFDAATPRRSASVTPFSQRSGRPSPDSRLR